MSDDRTRARGALPRRRAHRSRRHGRRPRRIRHPPRPPGRDQAPEAAARERPRVPHAVPPGGAGRRPHGAPHDRARLRRRRGDGRRPGRPRGAAARSSSWSSSRAACSRTSSPTGPLEPAEAVRDHRRHPHGARVLAPRRRRAPRHQARQHHGHRHRPGEGDGLRHRARGVRLVDDGRRRPRAILGTAAYFSPEQAKGETVDARTDLYSTGVVLFELLTGRPPFRGDTAGRGRLPARERSARSPPSVINPTVSPALDAVVLRALAKDRVAAVPDARRSSAPTLERPSAAGRVRCIASPTS